MENVFVPIDARTDPRYFYVKNNPLYKDFFEGFFDYQTDLSFKAGKVNKSSGKAQSYRNHLMKIIVFYKEVYGSYPTSLESEKTAAGIEAFFRMNDFVKLNREKNSFYSATINGYLDYLDQLKVVNADEIKGNPSERYKIKLLKKPTRKKPVQTSILQYPRNPHEMLAAKHRSEWKCCYDSDHETFISENEHKNFVEGHHLIPMQHQCDFEYTIDFADNIILIAIVAFILPSSRTETGCLRNFTLNVLMILRFMELIFRLMSWNRIMYKKSRLRCGLLFSFRGEDLRDKR